MRVLEKEIGDGGWSPGFFEQLRRVDSEHAETVDQMLESIRARRASKGPRRL